MSKSKTKSLIITRTILVVAFFVTMGRGNSAVVIDFESLRIDDSDLHEITSPYSEDGFQLTTLSAFRYRGTLDSLLFAGSTGLFTRAAEDTVHLSSTDAFDFFSIDIDWLESGPPNNSIQFVGYFVDGSSLMESVTIDSQRGYETFEFLNFQNVTRVAWAGRAIQFDNITVTVVPEPSGVWMFFTSGLLITLCRRR